MKLQNYLLHLGVKIDLSVCSIAKHGRSVTARVRLPEHKVDMYNTNKKRVQII